MEPQHRHEAYTVDVVDTNDLLCNGRLLEDKRKHEQIKLSVRFELEQLIWDDADLCSKLYPVDVNSVAEALATPAVTQVFAKLRNTEGSEVAFHAPLCDLYNDFASATAIKVSLPVFQILYHSVVPMLSPTAPC